MSATSDTQTTGAVTESSEQSRPKTNPETETEQNNRQSEPQERNELPLDQVFSLLKNRRRRDVLKYLRGGDGEAVSIGELAEHIAAIENDTTVDAISSSQRKRVYVGLYQCHLPKMDDMNVIEFNRSRGKITIGENAPQLEKFLDSDGSSPYERHWYYAVVSGGGVALYGLSLLAAAPTFLTAELVLVGVVLGIVACIGLNVYEQMD